MVAQKTLASFRERIIQLYEQGADVRFIGPNTMITQLLQSLT
jgi:hypothetical protein